MRAFFLNVACVVAAIGSTGTCHARVVTFVNAPTDNRFATINGITINSVVYNVTFRNDVSYTGVQNAVLPASPITFSTQASAQGRSTRLSTS